MSRLTPQQLAHILAAVRHCQAYVDLAGMPQFTSTGLPPLDNAEIDSLCEDLNTTKLADSINICTTERGQMAILTFPLPECADEFKMACGALDLVCAWNNYLEQVLRPMIKWPPEDQSEEVYAKVQELFDKALESLRDYNVEHLLS